MQSAELRRLLDAWPAVLRLASDPWAKAFAASIWQQAGNGHRWIPSGKQLAVMRAMVRQIDDQTDDGVVLIEG